MAGAPARAAPSSALAAQLRQAFRDDAPLCLTMAAYVAAAWAIALAQGLPFSLTLYAVFWLLTALAAVILLALSRAAPPGWRMAQRVAVGLPIMVLLPAFFSAFTSLKSAMGHVRPYDWDGRLGAIDRAVLGADAWRVLQPVLGHPPVTFALSAVYSSWHPTVLLIFTGFTVSLGRPILRLQALLAFLFTWVALGTFTAFALSSAGPRLAGSLGVAQDRFSDQAAYLRQAAIHWPTLDGVEQRRLLAAAASGWPQPGAGIAAMPSLHVAVAMLLVFLGFRTSRIAGAAALIYLAVIALGSVHLGWHYAADGVVAMAGAALIWPVAGWAAKAHLARTRPGLVA